MGFIEAIIALCFLIFIHELGHFLAAKACGVHIEAFSIGFGPAIFAKTFNNTRYILALIPLGGYVKLKGQNDLNPLHKDNSSDSYSTKKTYQKIIILSAGVAFNFILAFLLYVVVGIMGIKALLPIVGDVSVNSAAFEAGILKNDKILVINDRQIHSWSELNEAVLKSGDKLNLLIQRGDETLQIRAVPKISNSKNIFGEDIKRPMLGITASNEVGVVHYKNLELLKYAMNKTLNDASLIFQSIQKLILGVIPIDQLGGVIGIVSVMADLAPNGISAFLLLVALISVNLGVLNLLPIPVLDGGQMMFCLYEGITKRPISQKALYVLSMLGWVILIALMLLGIYNDIIRLMK